MKPIVGSIVALVTPMLDHGDIERLRIQNGVPVLAELITQKVKFSS